MPLTERRKLSLALLEIARALRDTPRTESEDGLRVEIGDEVARRFQQTCLKAAGAILVAQRRAKPGPTSKVKGPWLLSWRKKSESK